MHFQHADTNILNSFLQSLKNILKLKQKRSEKSKTQLMIDCFMIDIKISTIGFFLFLFFKAADGFLEGK